MVIWFHYNYKNNNIYIYLLLDYNEYKQVEKLEVTDMAFMIPFDVFTTQNGKKLQFLHEIIRCPDDTGDPDGFRILDAKDYYQLIFFNAGSRDIMVENRIQTFTAGDIFFASPGQKVAGRAIPSVLDRYYLYIQPEVFEHLAEFWGVMSLFASPSNKLTLPAKQQSVVKGYLSNTDLVLKFGDNETKKAEAFAYIIQFLSYLSNTIKNPESYIEKNQLLLDILSFIESTFDTVTITKIEKEFGISRSSLWRLFKSDVSLSPSEYILKIKLENARLLLMKDFPVATVSDMCGFSDCSYFTKKFKGRFGITPKQVLHHNNQSGPRK